MHALLQIVSRLYKCMSMSIFKIPFLGYIYIYMFPKQFYCLHCTFVCLFIYFKYWFFFTFYKEEIIEITYVGGGFEENGPLTVPSMVSSLHGHHQMFSIGVTEVGLISASS